MAEQEIIQRADKMLEELGLHKTEVPTVFAKVQCIALHFYNLGMKECKTALSKGVKSITEVPNLPTGCRCRKLNGWYVPQSCRVLNGRKKTCKDLILPEESNEQDTDLII